MFRLLRYSWSVLRCTTIAVMMLVSLTSTPHVQAQQCGTLTTIGTVVSTGNTDADNGLEVVNSADTTTTAGYVISVTINFIDNSGGPVGISIVTPTQLLGVGGLLTGYSFAVNQAAQYVNISASTKSIYTLTGWPWNQFPIAIGGTVAIVFGNNTSAYIRAANSLYGSYTTNPNMINFVARSQITSMSYTVLSGCSSLNCSVNTVQTCNSTLRSTCHVDYTNVSAPACVNNPLQTLILCPSITTALSCANSYCFWDPYLSKCYNNITQVNALFPCSIWTGFDNTYNLACTYHGCQVVQGTSPLLCVTAGTLVAGQVDNSLYVDYTKLASVVGPTYMNNNTSVTFTVTIPFQARQYASTWPLMTTGNFLDLTYLNKYLSNSVLPCTGQSAPNQPLLPPTSPVYLGPLPLLVNQSTVMQHVVNWMRLTQSMVWNTSDSNGQWATSIYGNMTTSPTSLITSATLSIDNQYWSFQHTVALNQLTACLGATGINTGFGQYYTLPYTWIERNAVAYYSAASLNVKMLLYNRAPSNGVALIKTSGGVFGTTVMLLEALPVGTGCALGQQRLLMSYLVSFGQQDNPSMTLGPRSVIDVFTNTSSSGLINCYGDNVVSVTPTTPRCVNWTCTYNIVMQSRCRPIASDGQAFSFCNRANLNDIIADLGGGGVSPSYPSTLNGVHSFYVVAYACPANSTDYTGCVMINNAPNSLIQYYTNRNVDLIASSVLIPVSFNITVMPNQSDIFLPAFTMDSILYSAPTVSSLPSVSINSSNTPSAVSKNVWSITNNATITTGYISVPLTATLADQLVFVVQLHNAALQQSTTIQLQIGTLVIEGINIFGQSNSSAVLTGATVMPYLTYLPKAVIASSCPGCPAVSLCVGVLGCDGFSMPLFALRQLLVATAYRLTVTAIVYPVLY